MLRSMFEARKSVFVDLLKWDVPVLDGRYEIDQFDDGHATYLIVADERRRASRLGPPASNHAPSHPRHRSFPSCAPDASARPRRIRDHALLPRRAADRRARGAERATGW